MPRAAGVDVMPDPEVALVGHTAIGVFLETVDGRSLEWKYAPEIEDDAEIGHLGFSQALRTVDDLGNLPEWWRKAGVQRESEPHRQP